MCTRGQVMFALARKRCAYFEKKDIKIWQADAPNMANGGQENKNGFCVGN